MIIYNYVIHTILIHLTLFIKIVFSPLFLLTFHFIPKTKTIALLWFLFLVGLARFELAHARVKVWCLTAWLQPNVFNLCTHELSSLTYLSAFLENTYVFSAPRYRISVIPFSHNIYPSLATAQCII